MGFFEFNIAMTGLNAAQRGLQVTSNNITNQNTEGYSKQELGQKASMPLTGIGVGMVGTGVDTTGIHRVRDAYIDQKLWSQSPKLGEYNIKVQQNQIVEGAFGEPSDTGFTSAFNDLFAGISNLSTDPSSSAAKVALKEQMTSYTRYFNNITSSLTEYQQNLNFDIKNTVNEINTLGSRIRSLNEQILNAEIYGAEASTFRDERDLCLDRLSQLIDIDVQEQDVMIGDTPLKKMTVRVAGQTLVDHNQSNSLELEVRGQREKDIDAMIDKIKTKIEAQADCTDELKELARLSKNLTFGNNEISYKTVRGENITLLTVDANGQVITNKAGDGKYHVDDAEGLYDITWSNGVKFQMNNKNMSGELKGLLDMRDGAGTEGFNTYNGIPYFIERMNGYVRQFARTMNESYSKDEEGYVMLEDLDLNAFDNNIAAGTTAKYMTRDADKISFFDEDKNLVATYDRTDAKYDTMNNSYRTKYVMFSYSTGNLEKTPIDSSTLDYRDMTVATFSISQEVFDDYNNLRTVYDELNPSDTSLMLEVLGQKDNTHMFREGTPTDYMASIFAELGIGTREAEMYQSTQTSVVGNLTNQRLSVSQVDNTEEFTFLIQYQHAYQAAAKVMSTIDGIYETCIFKLGNW